MYFVYASLFVYNHWITSRLIYETYSYSCRSHWLLGRCGRPNSPPASSVMEFIVCCSDGSHESVDTVHPSLLRSSSFSSPMCTTHQIRSSYVLLVSPIDVSKPSQSCFAALPHDTIYIQSVPDVIVNHKAS